jgi:hypothetical protein
MGNGWPFRRSNHDHDASSSLGGKKKERQRHCMSIDVAWQLFEENKMAPWGDVILPSGSPLNSRHVLVHPMPCQGHEHRDEVRRRLFILPPDLRNDPTIRPPLRQLAHVWILGV